MIQYNANEENDVKGIPGYSGWVNRYKDFLEEYKKDQTGAATCSHNDGATKDKVCKFDLSQLGECENGKFGYNTANPCIILELNKIEKLNYSPVNVNDFPDEMSVELKEHIKRQADKDQVWVECQGER